MIVRRARASHLEKLLRAGRLESQRKLDLRRERSRRIRDVDAVSFHSRRVWH